MDGAATKLHECGMNRMQTCMGRCRRQNWSPIMFGDPVSYELRRVMFPSRVWNRE